MGRCCIAVVPFLLFRFIWASKENERVKYKNSIAAIISWRTNPIIEYTEYVIDLPFPVHAKHLSKTVLSLPIHTEMDTEQQDYIIETLINILNG